LAFLQTKIFPLPFANKVRRQYSEHVKGITIQTITNCVFSSYYLFFLKPKFNLKKEIFCKTFFVPEHSLILACVHKRGFVDKNQRDI
jgi:hypothetical protein